MQFEGQLPSPGLHVATSSCAAGHEDPLPLCTTLMLYSFVQPAVHTDHTPTQSMSSMHSTESVRVPSSHEGCVPASVYPESHAFVQDAP